MIYTTSKIKALLSCKGFQQSTLSSVALERGSIIHDILENGVDGYNKEGSTYRGTFRPYKHLDEIDLKELEDIATDFMKEHPEFFTDDWFKEVELNAFLKDWELSGILDKFIIRSTTATILDWKTGVSRADTKSQLDMLQAIMYAYIVFENYPFITDVTFSYIYIDSDNDFVTVRFNVNDIPMMKAFIEKMITATFYTGYRVNSKCRYCANKSTCPMLLSDIDTLEKKSIKEIKDIKTALESYLKEYKEKKLEEAKKSGKIDGFSVRKYYYLDTSKLTNEEKAKFVKGKIKIAKKEALKYDKDIVEVRETYVLKG